MSLPGIEHPREHVGLVAGARRASPARAARSNPPSADSSSRRNAMFAPMPTMPAAEARRTLPRE